MIRIKGEKSSETNQRLLTILQCLFPKSQKIVIPKEMPANIFVKIIQYIAYEKLDFAMKEIVYELLSIDVNSSYASNSEISTNNNSNENEFNLNSNNMSSAQSGGVDSQINGSNSSNLNTQNAFLNNNLSSNAFKTSKENLIIHPLRMEIGLRAFIQIADTLQFQIENGTSPPTMPSTFNTFQNNEHLSIYLTNTNGKQNQSRPSILTDSLAREIGLSNYFEHIRRSFQDILKTLDCTIGRTFLMTRPDNTQSTNEGSVVAGTGSINSDNASNTNANNINGNVAGNSNSISNSLNSSQTGMSSVASNVASVTTNLLSSAQSTATSVVATATEVFAPSTLHNFNLHHSNTVGSNNNSSGSANMGKSMSADLNEHTSIQMTNNLM